MSVDNEDEESSYYLTLSENPLQFEPLRKMTNVFYDDKLNEIFTVVYSEDSTQVSVENPLRKNKFVYKINDRRHVVSIKFSPARSVLAIQKNDCSVDFITFTNYTQSGEFSRSCKNTNSNVLGFIWIGEDEILYVTNQGLELYQVDVSNKSVKFVKHLSLCIVWFLYYSKSNLVILCTGSSGNYLQPVFIHEGNFNKLPKFEVYGNPSYQQQRNTKPIPVYERDVTVTFFYGQIRIMVFEHKQNNGYQTDTKIAVYSIHKMVSVKKTHVLRVNKVGRFALNVVDDLVIVHHQITKTSSIFDIHLLGVESSTYSVHMPIVDDKSIQLPKDKSVELYSAHWVTFQPDIIIDVGIGYFWCVKLNLSCFVNRMEDKCLLMDFLTLRRQGKEHIIKVLCSMTSDITKHLEYIGKIFNRLNIAYRSKLELDLNSRISGVRQPNSVVLQPFRPWIPLKVILDQSDVYSHVLSKIVVGSSTRERNNHLIYIITEYVRSLTDYNIPIQHNIFELLINVLVLNKSFTQLHQFLQYHIITDSKPIACLLLSLENLYPAANQLALDMLHRLENATEEISEVLLSKGHVITAIKYNSSHNKETELSFRKYLNIAQNSDDPRIFYSVFVEFEKRELSAGRNLSNLTEGSHYDVYIKLFREKFHKHRQ